MKKSILKIESKSIKNIHTVKGGEDNNDGSFESVEKKPKRLG